MEITPLFAVLVPVVIGMSQLLKQYVAIKWVPAMTVFFGVVVAWLAVPGSLSEVLMGGMVVGLTAAGLYSGIKTTVK